MGRSLFILPDLPMYRSVHELQRYMALAVKVRAGKRQRQPRPGATCLRIASMTWAL